MRWLDGITDLMDLSLSRAWCAAVHAVTKKWTNLATEQQRKECGFNPWVEKLPWRRKWQPTNILVWEIPWTEEPGGIQSTGVAKESDALFHVLDKVCWIPVVHLCPALCNPMDCSTPGFPVLHYLSEFAQTHVH